MRRILDTGAPFTALIASNDLSGLGAMEVLREAGRHIPEDVAVIGFDDILEARSQLPPLTTIRHPTFTLGRQAVLSVLNAIEGNAESVNTRVKTQLVIRQSCGCRPESAPLASFDPSLPLELELIQTTLARLMADAIFEIQHSQREKIDALCLSLTHAFTSSLISHDPLRFETALQQLIQWLEAHDDACARPRPADRPAGKCAVSVGTKRRCCYSSGARFEKKITVCARARRLRFVSLAKLATSDYFQHIVRFCRCFNFGVCVL